MEPTNRETLEEVVPWCLSPPEALPGTPRAGTEPSAWAWGPFVFKPQCQSQAACMGRWWHCPQEPSGCIWGLITVGGRTSSGPCLPFSFSSCSMLHLACEDPRAGDLAQAGRGVASCPKLATAPGWFPRARDGSQGLTDTWNAGL